VEKADVSQLRERKKVRIFGILRGDLDRLHNIVAVDVDPASHLDEPISTSIDKNRARFLT
jgi:hypothetical protein